MKFIKLLCKAYNLKMYYARTEFARDYFVFTFINPLTGEIACYHASISDLQMLDYNTKKFKSEPSSIMRNEYVRSSWRERQYLIEKLEKLA